MDRDEFMELVYETFADEPDNVLANGIIEAADAYAEHEKAQLSQQGTTKGATSDLISKTEVVKHLRRMLESTVPNTDYDEGFIDGVEFGISTVSTMPTVQPVANDTNVGDKISRQAVLDAIVQCTNCGDEDTLREYVLKHSLDNGWTGGILEALDAVKDLPPAQPEPQVGHWIRTDCGLDVECKCSKCGYRDFVEPRDEYWFKRNFCPNCGAKMQGATT